MLIRVGLVLALAGGIAAAAAGATPPLARNGLLVFSRQEGDRIPYPQIYLISATGSQRRRVSPDAAYGDPRWSPDGRAIAYPDGQGVEIIRADGRGRPRRVRVNFEEHRTELDWGPDGRRLAITHGSLYVKTLGGPLRRLTNGWAEAPSWSPDGRLIAYRSYGRILVVRVRDGGRRLLASGSPPDGEWPQPASWSPEGRRLVYDLGGALYVTDVRTGKRRRLATGRRNLGPLWSPDGRWIAFRRARPAKRWADVFVIRPDGTGLARLTRDRHYEHSLTWSPSGRRLAYSGRRGDVFVVGIASRRTRKISRRKCGEGAGGLAWSPRARRLAFIAEPVRKDPELVTADASGAGIRALTDDCFVWERNPAWSPRGNEVAYDRLVGSERHIFVVGVGASGARRITTNPGGGTDPSWSPDGRRLVFTRTFPGSDFYDYELFTIGADGTGERQLTDGPGASYFPDWSPRGDRIAFTSTRPEGGIYVVNTDGSGASRLGAGGAPAWSPDGSRIAFVREYNIWTMNADGSEPVRLTRRDGYTRAETPAWSPDGTRIVFAADVDDGRGSQWALFTVEPAGGAIRWVPFEHYQDALDPDWQPLP